MWGGADDGLGGLTWKTLGALTNEARAEDRVAEKIPAVMIGPNPETMLITWQTNERQLGTNQPNLSSSRSWFIPGNHEGVRTCSQPQDPCSWRSRSQICRQHQCSWPRTGSWLCRLYFQWPPSRCRILVWTLCYDIDENRIKGIIRHEPFRHLLKRQRPGTRCLWSVWPAGFLWEWPTGGPATNITDEEPHLKLEFSITSSMIIHIKPVGVTSSNLTSKRPRIVPCGEELQI